MKDSITISGVRAYRTSGQTMGTIEVMVEVGGKWVTIHNEKFDPDGFHQSHIVEPAGIRSRSAA